MIWGYISGESAVDGGNIGDLVLAAILFSYTRLFFSVKMKITLQDKGGTRLSVNFLLITVDDMNYDAPGAAGSRIAGITPNIDRLAAEGMRFVHSHVTIAVCQPSRSVLMTGRYPHRNGALGFEPVRQDVPTLQEQLHQAGYLKGIIGKEEHIAPKEKFCWDSYVRTMGEESGFGRDPQVYYARTKQFLEQANRENKPFFLMANSHDPHRPFAGSDDERNRYGRYTPVSRTIAPEEVDVPGFLPDIENVRKEVAEYYTSVHRADETVGEILRALRESGHEDDTLVMFLSDNGMAFPFAKTNCYLTSTRTPWIVRWPGKVRPGSVDGEHFISGIDFMPTILEAAGLPQVDGTDGRSFLPVLEGRQATGRDQVFTVFNRTSGKKDFPMRCIQNRKYGYIYNAWSNGELEFKNESQAGLTFRAMQQAGANDPAIADRVEFFLHRVREELYDFEQDPCALHNLVNEPEHAERVAQMRQELYRRMEQSDDPIAAGFKAEFGL
jgi:N-sulfoglucosamine sulfohydrolase